MKQSITTDETWEQAFSREYADVIEGIRQLGIPAKVWEPNMTAWVITWPYKSGYWLLTDATGPLPDDRADVEGWALGRYDDPDKCGEADELATTDDPTAEGAVELVMRTALKGRTLRRPVVG